MRCGGIASGARTEKGWYCPDCATPASIAAPPRVGEHPRAGAGIISGNVRGVSEDGGIPEGAYSWEYRPPGPTERLHRSDAITYQGHVSYQQSPPIAVKGSRPPATSAKGEKGTTPAADKALAPSDLAALFAPLTEREREVYRLRKLAKWTRQEIAERLGMTLTAVKRALERGAIKVRREVPVW